MASAMGYANLLAMNSGAGRIRNCVVFAGGIGDGKLERAGDRQIGFVEQEEVKEDGIARFVDHSAGLHYGPEG